MGELFNVRSKVVVITGGSGYLGSAVVKELLKGGALVADADLAPLDIDGADETNFINVVCDVSKTASIKNMFETVKNRFGRIDVLINCATYGAGYGPAGTVNGMNDADWEKGLDGTAGVTFRCTREAIPYFGESGGNIVNFASMYGVISPDPSIYGTSGQNNPCNYGAGKAAVLQFTRYCAAHLAHLNIRVNAVTPGTFPDPKKAPPVEFMENLKNKTMLKRVGKPGEIAGAVVFLASDASSYMTGANIVVDGGWTAW